MVYLDPKVEVKEFLERAAMVKDDDAVKVSVRMCSLGVGSVRITLYWEITDDDVDAAIKKLKLVIQHFEVRNQL